MTQQSKGAVLAVILGLASFAIAPAGAGARPKPKPDLALAHARLLGRSYEFTGKRADIDVKDTTENSGHAAAGPTVNRLTLHHKGAAALAAATRAVPKLRKGKSDSATGTARIDIPDDAEPGAYQVTLCADATDLENEEDEIDNCKGLGRIYLVKKRWGGSIGGQSSPYPGVTETWRATDAKFDLESQPGEGSFVYGLSQGTVTYTDSGSFGGCTYTGSGVDGGPRGTLRLAYAGETYYGEAFTSPGFTYPIVLDCNGSIFTTPGPIAGNVVLGTNTQPLPFGKTTLAGTEAGPGATYNWNLK
jgi:hypothetical protein